MSLVEIKDQAIEFGTQQIANLQDNLKEIDWKGLPVKVLNIVKEQGSKAYENAKTESFTTTFRKAYRIAEMIPGLNGYAGLGRAVWSFAYGTKVVMASWTVRPFTLGISGTFKTFWTEEMPYIVKQAYRGVVVAGVAGYYDDRGYLTGLGYKWTAAAMVATYDLATNNIEFFKENKYIPNYWV